MKKAMIILGVVALGATVLPSCNKDYTCICELNGAEVSRSSVREKTKNAAEDECNKMGSSVGVTYECYID